MPSGGSDVAASRGVQQKKPRLYIEDRITGGQETKTSVKYLPILSINI